jgi:hypothetical protein
MNVFDTTKKCYKLECMDSKRLDLCAKSIFLQDLMKSSLKRQSDIKYNNIISIILY